MVRGERNMNKKRKAQVAVEAVIGIPLFLLLVLGAIETARIALRRVQITYASFMTTRVASVNKGELGAIKKTLEKISDKIKDAEVTFKEQGEFYSIHLKKKLDILIPWVKPEVTLEGFSAIPKGNYLNKPVVYEIPAYSTYYPGVFSAYDTKDGILHYDRNWRGFVKQENNFLEHSPWGSGGEAEIVKSGEDEPGDPFHLGGWYPPKGIMRNPPNRTGWKALQDQYAFVMAMMTYGFKPYFSRTFTGFGHGDNLRFRKYAWTYWGPLGAVNFDIAEHAWTMYRKGNPWSSSGGTFIWGFGSPIPCEPWPTPYGCVGVVWNPPTTYVGSELHYIGQGNYGWKGTRRLYDSAFFVSTPLEFLMTYISKKHGHQTPMKDDLAGVCTVWKVRMGICCTGYGIPFPHRTRPHYEDK
jgi:hypothetical protein